MWQPLLITIAYGAAGIGILNIAYDLFVAIRNRRLKSVEDAPDQIAHGDVPAIPRTFRDTSIASFPPVHSTAFATEAQRDHVL